VPIDEQRFKRTMGLMPSGICVVTLTDEGGAAIGMTASAVTSLSLRPPMLLVCVDDDAAIRRTIAATAFFGVSVLAGDQSDVATRFADRKRHRFEPGEAFDVGPAEVPLVPGALAHIECRRADVFQGGDHAIVCGLIEWSDTREGRPLLYWRGSWGPLPL
jgi:4-nitrophenol 2-monooxygenase / 4-nitrocatechol 4-monooxygenase, reductase component